jgi:hypothetical protein
MDVLEENYSQFFTRWQHIYHLCFLLYFVKRYKKGCNSATFEMIEERIFIQYKHISIGWGGSSEKVYRTHFL